MSCCVFILIFSMEGRVVSVLDSRLRSPGSSPGQGRRVFVFLGKTLDSHRGFIRSWDPGTGTSLL